MTCHHYEIKQIGHTTFRALCGTHFHCCSKESQRLTRVEVNTTSKPREATNSDIVFLEKALCIKLACSYRHYYVAP